MNISTIVPLNYQAYQNIFVGQLEIYRNFHANLKEKKGCKYSGIDHHLKNFQ